MAEEQTKVGILLGTRGLVMRAQQEGTPLDASPVLRLAERAEAAGLDSVWVGDTLTAKPRLEPVSVLAAISAVTSRVGLGTAVLLPALRHPVTMAHSLATVDILSQGRVVVAAGAGGAFTPDQIEEWHAAGVDPKTRGGRLTETVQIMKRLWTEDGISHDGRYFKLNNVTLEPKPVRPGGIPVLLGCHHRTGSDAQYRRAARHADGIMGITDSPEKYAQVVSTVEELAAAEGRDPAALQRVFYLTVNINRDAGAAEAEAHDFLMRYYHVEHWGDRWGPWGGPELVAQRMSDYAQVGVGHLVVRFASWDQPAQLDAFIRDVLPSFRAAEAKGF